MAEPAHARMSYAEYLELERRSGTKHEYVAGIARAMAGGTIEHGRLAFRFGQLIGAALAGRGCEGFSSDTRIRIDELDRATYADLVVICGEIVRSAVDPEAIVNPTILVEVLSDSTEAYDRGEKFRIYRRLASLREYVLVSQRERLVEVWRRDGSAWRVSEHGPGESIRIETLVADVSVDELYGPAPAG